MPCSMYIIWYKKVQITPYANYFISTLRLSKKPFQICEIFNVQIDLIPRPKNVKLFQVFQKASSCMKVSMYKYIGMCCIIRKKPQQRAH